MVTSITSPATMRHLVLRAPRPIRFASTHIWSQPRRGPPLTSGTSAPATVNLPSAITVGSIIFDSGFNYTLTGGGLLTLDVASGNTELYALGGGSKIAVPTTVNDNAFVDIVSGASLTISAALHLANS